MPDPFTLQKRLFREIVAKRLPLAEGMSRALKAVQAAPHGALWKACEAPDWDACGNRWVKWFDDLLRKHPIPKNTELLWFEAPSELNPALTSVSAYEKLDRTEEAFGLDAGRFWPEDRRGETLAAGLLPLPELDAIFAAAGWNGRSDAKNADGLRPGVFALSYTYASLLAVNGLPRSTLLSRVETPGSVGVLVGWAGGDERPFGTLSSTGWLSLSHERSRQPPPEKLDPTSGTFDVRAFLRSGGDPNWRDPETQKTVLMLAEYAPASAIHRLIHAGADVKAIDKNGLDVLQSFGACELKVLQLLKHAGADFHYKSRDGWSAFERVITDGRCTVQHLDFYWKAGARTNRRSGTVHLGIQSIAESTHYNRSVQRDLPRRLAFWLKHGMTLDCRDAKGRTPLWIALHEHAKELTDHLSWLRENEDLGGTWDYHHDRVAIMLLEHGANPNDRLKTSKCRLIPPKATPLMVRRYDDDSLVKALLKHGADPHARCAKGKTALDYARQAAADPKKPGHSGAQDVVKVLERAMKLKTPAKKAARRPGR